MENSKKNRKLTKGASEDIKALCIIAAVYLILELVFKVTCPIKYVTGISCAGCGMSRAYFSLLRGDIASAFAYHPLFPVPILGIFIWIFREKVPKKMMRTFVWAAVILFIGVYMIRLFNPMDSIVVFEPRNGLIFRLIKWF